MTNWYFYKLYGIKIKINQKIIGLKPYDNLSEDYKIIVNYKAIENEKISIDFIDNVYTIWLYKYSMVKIYNDIKIIEWDAKDYCSFISTFFNIPFSILCLLKGDCLLHTSTIKRNNQLYGFCAKQGVGKSTLCFLLNDAEYKFFSDDTLSINNCFRGTRGSSIIKLTDESLNLKKTKNAILYENVNDKKCMLLNEDQGSEYPLRYLFFLERTTSDLNITPIEDKFQRKIVLYDHIVGINYFKYIQFKMVDDFITSSDMEKIKMYKLKIPNNLNFLKENALKIKGKITEITKE